MAAEDERAIRAAIDEVRKVMAGDSGDQINAALKDLEKASHHLAEAMYQKAGASTGAGDGPRGGDEPRGGAATGPSAGGRKEGDVIDAEFVDVDEKKQ